MHIGCEVVVPEGNIDATYTVIPSDLQYYLSDGRGAKLVLRPLSSITDEEAIECAKIVCRDWSISKSELRFEIHPNGIDDENYHIDDSVFCVKVQTFIENFQGGKWVTYFVFQIDRRKMEVGIGLATDRYDGFVDSHTDNVLQVYDYLRSLGFCLPFLGKDPIAEGWAVLSE